MISGRIPAVGNNAVKVHFLSKYALIIVEEGRQPKEAFYSGLVCSPSFARSALCKLLPSTAEKTGIG